MEKSSVEKRLEQFRAASREAGVKLTHQRIEILRQVSSSVDHPDADTVFRCVRARMPTISLDTVYRTLRTLERLGLITTLSPRRDSVRFDANLKHHHHYVCILCGRVKDFESEELNDLRVPNAARDFGSVVGTHVEVRGVCEKCSKGSGTSTHFHGHSRQHRVHQGKDL
jgi:Fur family transcriptional regulator, peroxide stress response regulator